MSHYIPVDLRRKVREQFGNCCAYCKTAATLSVAIFEVEHIVPRSAGGGTELANLCYACPTCNRYKASRQLVPDFETGQFVPLFHPQQDDWHVHFEWAANGTELHGLTATGRATIASLQMNRPQLVRVRRMWVKLGEHPPDQSLRQG